MQDVAHHQHVPVGQGVAKKSPAVKLRRSPSPKERRKSSKIGSIGGQVEAAAGDVLVGQGDLHREAPSAQPTSIKLLVIAPGELRRDRLARRG